MIANCPCEHCEVNIEFATEEFLSGSTIICPKCGKDTTLYVSPQAKPAPEPAEPVLPPPSLQSKPDVDIYLDINGEQRGPYAKSQVQTMWNNGVITSDALYWHEGMSDWATISALIPEFAVSLPTPTSPVPQKILPTQTHYDPKTATFTGTMTQMVKLAMRAVQDLGWKLDNVNENIGIVNFQANTGWGSYSDVSCTLTIEEAGESTFRVNGISKLIQRGGFQLISAIEFGEAERKAGEAINRMRALAS